MPQLSHESFLRHRGFRDLKLASGLCLSAIAAYLWHDPVQGPSGGTWLGYTLGGLSAALILMLAWLGVRKRRYGDAFGTAKGWLSAHVYLGLSLITLTVLHTGFQWGANIHTLALVLMLVVILSGIYGVVAYTRYPSLISAQRANATQASWLDQIGELNDEALKLADRLEDEVRARVLQSIGRMRIGGGVGWQLFGGRTAEGHADNHWLADRLSQAGRSAPSPQSTAMFMAQQLATQRKQDPEEVGRLRQLIELLARRNELVSKLNQDIQLHARMRIWLYVHVPLSVALLAALVAHVFSVFLYW